MKLLRHWSAMATLVTFVIRPYTATGAPLSESQSDRPGQYTIRLVESDWEARRLAIMGETEPDTIEREDSPWYDAVVTTRMAEESSVESNNAAHGANVEGPLSVQMSQGTRREKARRRKRSSEAGDELNHDQSPTTPDGIPEAQPEATADKVKKGKIPKPRKRYTAVTPEELDMVLSPEDKAKYEHLRARASGWKRQIRMAKAAEAYGIPLSKQQEEQLRIGREASNELDRMKSAIQRKLIKLGKARPEVVARAERHRERMKKYTGGRRSEKNRKQRAKYKADGVRRKFLEARKAERGFLSRDEQRELDALLAKREHTNALQRAYWQRTGKSTRKSKKAGNEAPSEDVSHSEPSGGDTPSPEIPPADRLEMSTGQQQQPGTKDASTAQMHFSPAENRRTNQWHADLLPFFMNNLSGGTRGKAFLDRLSSAAARLNRFSGITPAAGIRPSAPMPAPRILF